MLNTSQVKNMILASAGRRGRSARNFRRWRRRSLGSRRQRSEARSSSPRSHASSHTGRSSSRSSEAGCRSHCSCSSISSPTMDASIASRTSMAASERLVARPRRTAWRYGRDGRAAPAWHGPSRGARMSRMSGSRTRSCHSRFPPYRNWNKGRQLGGNIKCSRVSDTRTM